MFSRSGRFLYVIVLCLAIFTVAISPLQAQSGTAAAFDRIKALSGKWVGKTPEGAPFTTTFRVTSAGSAVLQLFMEGTAEEMPTMYHLDGDRLMVTHYCMFKNQPRMVAAAADASGNTIRFHFLDVTNLAGPDAGHMRELALTFLGTDKVRQVWTFRQDGKDSAMSFEAERQR